MTETWETQKPPQGKCFSHPLPAPWQIIDSYDQNFGGIIAFNPSERSASGGQMKYLAITLLLAGAAFATFVPGMYPCPFDKEIAYRHDACSYERNTIICSFSHTHRGAKGPLVHKFSIQFPYGTPTEE